ncbi:transcriptional repressor TCF25-domain-containing protein [Xylariomycetidae sp. FL0641]|nr:transcriptional repressor TCF25-domain-containing protein [Xylariomycetidae sp. FL0641]
MSSRQLRKLQKQRELEALQAHDNASGSESDDDVPVTKPKTSMFSGFAALGDSNDQDEDADDQSDHDQHQHPDPDNTPSRTDTPKSASKKSKKKKKKAKKSDNAPVKNEKATADAQPDIDRILRELELEKSKSGKAHDPATDTTPRAYERICELLRINTYHLKVVNEMRNLFGREAITIAENEENEERRAPRQRRGLPQQVDLETFLKGLPGKTLPEITLRRNPFLPGKETWPHAPTEGLTMKQIKDGAMSDKVGTVEFGFAHDERYNRLEMQFFALVQMYDPMQLVHFLHRHPYHISSLIQVSKVAKQDQNSALSADLCERALFTFGRVSLSSFRQKLDEGKARLDFRRPENRQFWLAGYHYLKSLVLKGTYRTALEWAKLLLSMDLSDPYGIIHFLHPMAIRAHESKWFIDFCDSEALDECETAQDYIRQTLVLARLQQGDNAGAKALLVEGMERLPWLYNSLFSSLNLDIPKFIWGIQPRDQHEALFSELYVHQAKGLWDNTQALSLLKETFDLPRPSGNQTFSYPPRVGRNTGRFVYLDNTPSLMALVPDGILSSSPNWEFDPLPPPLDENILSYESQSLQWKPNRPTSDGGAPSIQDRRALRQLLERAVRGGAPQDIQEALRDALDEIEGNLDQAGEVRRNEGDGEDGDDAPPDGSAGLGGLVQAFMDLFHPPRSAGDDDDSEDDGSDGMDMMPGAWATDSEGDEMPPLVPQEEQNDEGDATDDEMPPPRHHP